MRKDVEVEVFNDLNQQISLKLCVQNQSENIIVTLVYAKYNANERAQL